MSWKEILAFADGSPDGLVRVRLAAELARVFGAHLEVQSFAAIPEFPMTEAAGAVVEDYARARADANVAAETAVAEIGRLVQEGPHASVYRRDVWPGGARRAAAVLARTADLVVLGRPEDIDASRIDSELVDGALMAGGRPCLVIPRWPNLHSWGKRAMVAWKGTPEASRAVAAAAPLLAQAECVRVCVVNPRGEEEGEGERALGRLATYLMRHGAKVEETVTFDSSEPAAKVIAEEAATFNADLLVMGAYGHSRVREWAFGGVTRAMLRSATIPVLMAH